MKYIFAAIANIFVSIWSAGWFFHIAGPNPQTWIQGCSVATAVVICLSGFAGTIALLGIALRTLQ